jgi:hypothetical protein
VVLTPDFQAKLIDCGLALYKAGVGHVLAAGTVATTSGLPVGTPKYCCPQYLKGKSFDAKSEVFSVGVVLLELVTGRVQGLDCNLYDECIVDEEDVVPDERAGNWQAGCIKKVEKIARNCLEKRIKRLSSMIDVMRLLRAAEEEHCQQTEEERIKSDELVRLQREIDDAKTQGVLVQQLMLQLKEQSERLTAHREAQRQAQEWEERELHRQDQRMEECMFCMTKYDRANGIGCPGSGHFVCAGCFNKEVMEQTLADNIGSFKKSNLRIRCRSCGADQVLMDVADLTRHLDKDTFDTYLRAREDVLVGDAMQTMEEKYAKQVSDLKDSILKLGAQREAVVLHHRVRIIEEILTLSGALRSRVLCASADSVRIAWMTVGRTRIGMSQTASTTRPQERTCLRRLGCLRGHRGRGGCGS